MCIVVLCMLGRVCSVCALSVVCVALLVVCVAVCVFCLSCCLLCDGSLFVVAVLICGRSLSFFV